MAFEEEMYDTDITKVRSLLRKAKRSYREMTRPFPDSALMALQLETKLGEKLHTIVETEGPLSTLFGFDKHGEILGFAP